MSRRDDRNAEYVRQLEDAVLLLWALLPAAETVELRDELPAFVDFITHLHHAIENRLMLGEVRVNVWDGCDESGRP